MSSRSPSSQPVPEPEDKKRYPPFGDNRKSLREYFQWRALPWWFCFFIGLHFLVRLQYVYNESPCAVLGTPSPVTASDVKKAFRTVSMCTHPDRIRAKGATAAEEERGKIIFKRATNARDYMVKMMGRHKNVTCPGTQGEHELMFLQLLGQFGQSLVQLGIADYWYFVTDWVWYFVTFQAGFMTTVLNFLWVLFLFRMLKTFFMYIRDLGIVRFFLGLVTNLLIGPIPTVIHFLILPVLRLVVFVKSLSARRSVEDEPKVKVEDDKENEHDTPDSAGSNGAPQLTHAMKAAAARTKELPAGVRQRKKKETEVERTKKTEQLRNAEVEQVQDEGEIVVGAIMPENMWKCIQMTLEPNEAYKARKNAADAVQFDLLLIFTKPIIPLCTLIALGQVFNGLISSLIIGHALRNWVPKMSHEAHHLMCVFFGSVHTLLGVNGRGDLEDFANKDDAGILMLEWRWSFKDALSVMHMIYVGAMVTATSSLGNEPSFAASFAAGIALRIALGQDSIKGTSVFKYIGEQVEARLQSVKVQFVASDEVVAYSGGGIGDCAGGPFRMLFGDHAALAARCLKAWLILLPLVATMQWMYRTYRIVRHGKADKKKRNTIRIVQRSTLAIFGLLQLYLIATVELNASNGGLYNFWVAMLFGCVGESLLSTFDVRGPPAVRQLLFLFIFLFI